MRKICIREKIYSHKMESIECEKRKRFVRIYGDFHEYENERGKKIKI